MAQHTVYTCDTCGEEARTHGPLPDRWRPVHVQGPDVKTEDAPTGDVMCPACQGAGLLATAGRWHKARRKAHEDLHAEERKALAGRVRARLEEWEQGHPRPRRTVPGGT